MYFTHASADIRRALGHNRRHTLLDIIIEDRWNARQLRTVYRTLRRRGLSPTGARGIIWDTARAVTPDTRYGEHDVWRTR